MVNSKVAGSVVNLLSFCLLSVTSVSPGASQTLDEVYTQQRQSASSSRQKEISQCKYIRSGIPIKDDRDGNDVGFLIKWNKKQAIGNCTDDLSANYSSKYFFISGPIIIGKTYRFNDICGRFGPCVRSFMWKREGDSIFIYRKDSDNNIVSRTSWGTIAY